MSNSELELRMENCRTIARKFFANHKLCVQIGDSCISHPHEIELLIEHMAVLLDTQWLEGWIKCDKEAHALAIKTGAM